MLKEPFAPDGEAVWRTRIYELEARAAEDARKIETLQIALLTARKIGAAIGVLMMTGKVTETEAFERLKQVSQACNRKLRDIADEVVLTGSLPSVSRRHGTAGRAVIRTALMPPTGDVQSSS